MDKGAVTRPAEDSEASVDGGGAPPRAETVRRLEAEVSEVTGLLNVAHGRLVALAAELIETGAWQGYGVKSVEHWLGWHAGLSGHRARQVTAVARRRAELPVTTQALAAGELSVDQVLPIVRHAPSHNDAEVASLAKVTTVPQLTSTLSRYRFDPPAADADDGDAGSKPDQETRRGSASMLHDGGRFGLRVDAPADHGAVIEQALGEAKDALFQSGHEDVTWMDALREVCQRSLSGVASTGRRDRFRVYVHLDTAAAGKSRRTIGWLNQGAALPPSLLDKLCCDGVVQPVWHTDGLPVSVGRSQRIVPERSRRLVLDRDRGCVVPGCEATLHLEVHRPRSHPDALTFRDGFGRPMPPRPAPTIPPALTTDASPDRPGGSQVPVRYRWPSGERLQQRWVHLTPPLRRETACNTAQPHAPPA